MKKDEQSPSNQETNDKPLDVCLMTPAEVQNLQQEITTLREKNEQLSKERNGLLKDRADQVRRKQVSEEHKDDFKSERDSLQKQLEVVTAERDEGAAALKRLIAAVQLRLLTGTVSELRTVDDVVNAMRGVADKLDAVVLASELNEARQQLAEAQVTLREVQPFIDYTSKLGQRIQATLDAAMPKETE